MEEVVFQTRTKMVSEEKRILLRQRIHTILTPLIHSDYMLLDLPYHSNLGDTLIWQGELDFLKSLPFKNLCSISFHGNLAKARKHIRPDTILLFHGGGNFGDLWPECAEFRKKVIAMFPHQRCIIFPQTVHYENESYLHKEAAFYSHHPNVTICARDATSLGILKKWFPNNPSLLVPDMAFAMNMSKYKKATSPAGSIFVKRSDREINLSIDYSEVPADAYVTDWLFLNDSKEYALCKTIALWGARFDSRLETDWNHQWTDWYWHHILRPLNVKTAIHLIDNYAHIYTTRMHAAILSILLGKNDITLYDNNYGKSSSLYNTWLNDVEGLKLIT